ncbi:MAG: hypothetical protein AAF907_05345 [Planctomycetota bacterium]
MICAFGFLWLAAFSALPLKARWGMAACATFSGLIAAASLCPSLRFHSVRAIGLIVLALFAGYAVSAWRAGGWMDAARASVGLLLLGLPAGYAAWTGRYPWWGTHAAAFPASEDPNRPDEPTTE